MSQVISFAQKGLILNKEYDSILTARYENSKYLPEKLNGKLFLPGGQIDFGEDVDESFIREVKEETGVTIKPLLPFYSWTWTYGKADIEKQIIAVARLGVYQSGELNSEGKAEGETVISKPFWLKLKDLKVEEFVIDEQPAIRNFLEYQNQNPFISSVH